MRLDDETRVRVLSNARLMRTHAVHLVDRLEQPDASHVPEEQQVRAALRLVENSLKRIRALLDHPEGTV